MTLIFCFIKVPLNFNAFFSKETINRSREVTDSPSCCNGLTFSNSSPLMLTATMWVVQLDIPGSKQVTAGPRTKEEPSASFAEKRCFKKKNAAPLAAASRVMRYLGWLRPPLLCSQFLLLAPSAQPLLHFRPHPSALNKMFSWERWVALKRLQNPIVLVNRGWVEQQSSVWTSDLQETPECSIPKVGGTASPSPRSLCGASASAGRWSRHLQAKRVNGCRPARFTEAKVHSPGAHRQMPRWLASSSSLQSPTLWCWSR